MWGLSVSHVTYGAEAYSILHENNFLIHNNNNHREILPLITNLQCN
jgi:hypothetical protein